MWHPDVPSVTQTSPTERDLSTKTCTKLHKKHPTIILWCAISNFLNKHNAHSHYFLHTFVDKILFLSYILLTCWDVGNIYSVTPGLHYCQKQKQSSTGAKELDRAKHGEGCSGSRGQYRPLYLKTRSLTHTHLRSSPTHLHKGQSLWQPQ